MLEVGKLAFGFPGRTVGRDVSFTLAAAKRCACSVRTAAARPRSSDDPRPAPPHGGTILLGGVSLESLSRREIAQRIGYVPQGHSATFRLTVRDFVLMGRTAHLGVFSVPGRKDASRSRSACSSRWESRPRTSR